MRFRLPYGTRQLFRYRTRDLNFVGRVENARFPVRSAWYSLNRGERVPFYVESIADPGIDWTFMYKDSPAVNRLKDIGDFNVEVPVADSGLRAGDNIIGLTVLDADGFEASVDISFSWDPSPIPDHLDLSDLSGFSTIQEVGQVVNGAFDLDRTMNLIRSRAPVYPDALFVVGGLHGSQEATYGVRFTSLSGVKWLGPSDFFVGHEGPEPPLGIKPGWSSAGMANIDPRWAARCFIAFGDHVGTNREWVVQTCPPKRAVVRPEVQYRVRHQVRFDDGVNSVRFRIWPEGDTEPESWLCDEDDRLVPVDKPRFSRASFSLFQHSGMPIEWSDIRVQPL